MPKGDRQRGELCTGACVRTAPPKTSYWQGRQHDRLYLKKRAHHRQENQHLSKHRSGTKAAASPCRSAGALQSQGTPSRPCRPVVLGQQTQADAPAQSFRRSRPENGPRTLLALQVWGHGASAGGEPRLTHSGTPVSHMAEPQSTFAE